MPKVMERDITQARLPSLLQENSESLLTCVHCGLCLPSCPTYRVLGNENDSPRGRIYLMRGVAEGRLAVADTFISHIDLCLGCRACESACPSGVPYGQLLEAARVEVAEANSARRSGQALLIRFVLNHVFTSPLLLGVGMLLARWLRDSGLARLIFESDALEGRTRLALALLLASRSTLKTSRAGGSRADSAEPEANVGGMRVAVLLGCVMEGLFTHVNRATERVLKQNGCELVGVDSQMCCGALHAHSGEIEAARQLARRNIEAFLASGCDRIVVNSAGCGAAMKEYAALLEGDPDFSERAGHFSSKVRDISEFLVEIGFKQNGGLVKRRIAYDAPCHLMHAQGVTEAPLDLLKSIPGVEIIPLPGYESCCGGAGIYNLQHAELSSNILSAKIAAIRASGADVVATGNPGCIMQIGAGVLLEGLKVDVLHPIELLDASD
jgi:glycolate oxidase iron-sulfur subunit